MQVKDGIATCREIAASLPEKRVLMLPLPKKHNAFVNALKSGVTGYVQMYSGK